jgi:hypothetical protein
MASNHTHIVATSVEQYEAFLQQAMEASIQSAKEEEFMLQAIKESLQKAEEEALIQKLDADSLECAIQASLQLNRGEKKPPSLLARRGMPPLTFTPKITQPSVNPRVDIIRPSSETKEWMTTTRC